MGQPTEEINFLLLFLTGTLGLLFLASTLILFVFVNQKRMLSQRNKLQVLKSSYQQEMLKAAIDAQEKERKRIAEDLHDEVGAMLSLARLNANRACDYSNNETGQKLTLDTIKIIDDTINNVRRISKDLLPSTLEEFGLIQAIEELVTKINASNIVGVKFEYQGEFNNLYSEVELALYRVTQELVNNAIKHAAAEEIDIYLEKNRDHLTLKVSDNGSGFKVEEVNRKSTFERGIGLKNIHSRVSMLDGEIKYLPNLPKGTAAMVKLDLSTKVYK